jgi:hypothetical protein
VAFEQRLAAQEQITRAEVAQFGHSRAELEAHRREAEAVRAGKIAELRAELARLDPGWVTGRACLA